MKYEYEIYLNSLQENGGFFMYYYEIYINDGDERYSVFFSSSEKLKDITGYALSADLIDSEDIPYIEYAHEIDEEEFNRANREECK